MFKLQIKEMRRLLLILLSTVLILPVITTMSISAQAPKIVREQTVIYNMWVVPHHFNPLAPSCPPIMGVVYEYLFLFDDVNLKLIPWIAESAKWVDDLTLEVKIRKGVYWQDGEPLTAKDVKYTYELGKRHPEIIISEPKVIWIYVNDIELVDDYTLRFHLKPENPCKLVLRSLLHCIVLPEHIWSKIEEQYEDLTEYKNLNPVGSGPYKIVYYDDTKYIGERWDDWWGAKIPPTPENPWLGRLPEPKYVIGLRVTSNEECSRLLIAGDMDYSQCFYPRVWEHFDEGIITWFKHPPFLGPTPKRTGGFFFNLKHYPINQTVIRRALAYAIDYEAICERAFSMYARPLDITCILPDSPLAFLRNETLVEQFPLKYDPEYAKKLLDDAGIIDRDGDGIREMPDGTKLIFKAEVPEGWTDWQIALEMLATYAEKIGIKIELKFPDPTTWEEDIRAGDFDITNWQGSAWTITGVYDFYRATLDSRVPQWPMIEGKITRYENEEVWQIIDEIGKYWDPFDPTVRDKLKALYGKLQYILARDLPFIPVWAWDNPCSYNTKYWVGWPTEESPGPRVNVAGEPECEIVLLMIRSTAAIKKIEYVDVWITGNVTEFIGADGKKYGPYKKGDFVRLPKEDADRLIGFGLASYTPPLPPELSEAIGKLASDIAATKSTTESLKTSIDELSSSISALGGSIESLKNLLYVVLVVSALALIFAILATIRAGKVSGGSYK